MSSTTEKIKERLSIVDVLSLYITLEKAGGSLKARCPFHHEKTPSFFVSPERNTYYCFGCGAKGDIFSFVEEFENLDFPGALKVLAEKAGVEIEEVKRDPALTHKKRLFECIEEACIFFQHELKAKTEALLYLKKRGLEIEMVRDWRIGFAPEDWHALEHHLVKKGFSVKEITDSGLIKQGEKGNQYSRFRGRVMFPIFDGSGRAIAFSGRILDPKSEEAKYINSPETLIFEKSKILFGYNKAKKEMREKGYTILVEGQMDLLMSHQSGFANTVASSGTAFTVEQAEIIHRLSDTILIAYDSDKAGQDAAFRAWRLALASGLSVKAVILPDGLDPADAIVKDSNLWKTAIEEAKNIIEYYAELLDGADKKRNDEILKEKILPLIASVESSIDQARFLQLISQKTGLPENALRAELAKVPALSPQEKPQDAARPEMNKIGGTSRKAIALLWYLKEKGVGSDKTFEESLQKIIPNFPEVLLHFEDEKETLLFEAQMHYANSPNLDTVAEESMFFLEEEILKERFAVSMSRLKKAEAQGDKITVETETKECHQISLQLSELKKKYFNKS